MPPDHRLGLHEHEEVDPARPQPTERGPQQPVGSQNPGAATALGEGRELLTEGEVLEYEISAAAEGRTEGGEYQEHAIDGAFWLGDGVGNLNCSHTIEQRRGTGARPVCARRHDVIGERRRPSVRPFPARAPPCGKDAREGRVEGYRP